MRRTIGMAAALALATVTTTAQGDTLSATLGEPLTEAKHEVKLTINRGVARYRVRRTFANAGKRHEEAYLRIGLPVGAAGTGLRIRAGNRWYDGELMRAERAAELYRELTGIGPHAPKDPALLYWRWASELNLQVFPIAPGRQSTVEYTLTAPTGYRNGRYFVSYPRAMGAAGLSAPKVKLARKLTGGKPWVDGKPFAINRPLVLTPPPGKPAWFGSRKPDATATYVSSVIQVADAVDVNKAKVSIDIRHTYRGDLKVELIAPDGSWHELHARGGSGDNDLRSSRDIELPKAVRAKGSWRLVVSDHAALDVGTLHSWSIELDAGARKVRESAGDTPMFLPDAPRAGERGHATISVEAPRIRTLAARLGRVPAATDKHFLRLEIDAAKQLRPLPKRLSAVFVVDASHSVVDGGIDMQLAMLRSFLRHVPDAHFDIVLYRRRAERLAGRFVAATDVSDLLKKARAAGKLDPGNGSALDEGLALAVKAMRRRAGARTIVVMSDALLRPSWHNRAALAELKKAPSGTIVHLAIPHLSDEPTREERDDDHALAPIAKRGGGVLLRVRGRPDSDAKRLDTAMLGLVRPIRIDHFRLDGVQLADAEIPPTLEEGVGIREMEMLAKAPASVVLSGKIWAKPYRKVVKVTQPFSRATAAFVFSLDMHHDLSEQEMFRVAMVGRAVSPVTSYLAIEPGVRPSRAGLEHGRLGRGAGYGSAHGRLGGSYRVRAPRPDLKAMLVAAAAACDKALKPAAGWSVTLDFATTYDEIVDIEATKQSPMSECIAEAGWKLRLTEHFSSLRDSFNVVFP